MRLILNPCTDPFFNLAAEEVLLDTASEPICMLWRNEKAVVVGKNQDVLSEIDRDYVEAHGIRVVRRMTGGGAVYHDLGNINYTLIEPDAGQFENYAHFTKDLIDFLATLGVKAEFLGRNDVLVDGKKICGNAQCVLGGRVLHHGCVLFDADLTALAKALKPDPEKLRRKGIASVRARVTNIRAHMPHDMRGEDFLEAFAGFMKERRGCEERALTEEEQDEIRRLAEAKYATREWTYGASPDWEQ